MISPSVDDPDVDAEAEARDGAGGHGVMSGRPFRMGCGPNDARKGLEEWMDKCGGCNTVSEERKDEPVCASSSPA